MRILILSLMLGCISISGGPPGLCSWRMVALPCHRSLVRFYCGGKPSKANPLIARDTGEGYLGGMEGCESFNRFRQKVIFYNHPITTIREDFEIRQEPSNFTTPHTEERFSVDLEKNRLIEAEDLFDETVEPYYRSKIELMVKLQEAKAYNMDTALIIDYVVQRVRPFRTEKGSFLFCVYNGERHVTSETMVIPLDYATFKPWLKPGITKKQLATLQL